MTTITKTSGLGSAAKDLLAPVFKSVAKGTTNAGDAVSSIFNKTAPVTADVASAGGRRAQRPASSGGGRFIGDITKPGTAGKAALGGGALLGAGYYGPGAYDWAQKTKGSFDKANELMSGINVKDTLKTVDAAKKMVGTVQGHQKSFNDFFGDGGFSGFMKRPMVRAGLGALGGAGVGYLGSRMMGSKNPMMWSLISALMGGAGTHAYGKPGVQNYLSQLFSQGQAKAPAQQPLVKKQSLNTTQTKEANMNTPITKQAALIGLLIAANKTELTKEASLAKEAFLGSLFSAIKHAPWWQKMIAGGAAGGYGVKKTVEGMTTPALTAGDIKNKRDDKSGIQDIYREDAQDIFKKD